MISRVQVLSRWIRRKINRIEWVIHFFGLSRSEHPPSVPGLVIVQIDGLARNQFEKALERGRLPFLKSLMERRHYRLHSFYGGMPSSTPAVQGELFYGVKGIIPAFSYRDQREDRVMTLFEPEDATVIQKRLEEQGDEPLLKGGSSYANIFNGGAEEYHFCIPGFKFGQLYHNVTPLSFPILLVLSVTSLVRMLFLFVIELVLAVFDFFRGLTHGFSFRSELKFILTRVSICILLRELTRIGMQIDMHRGLPIIHCNFLGYDEQAHRRGPSSAFAHWVLEGIDATIRRLWNTAHQAHLREYEVWVFSDHGQIDTEPYAAQNGEPVQRAVARVFKSDKHDGESEKDVGVQTQRARLLKRRWIDKLIPSQHRHERDDRPIVRAVGPWGGIYPPEPLDPEEIETLAPVLVREAHIPMIFTPEGPNGARAWTEDGDWRLPEQAVEFFGEDHPFLEEVTTDLLAAIHHRDAAPFMICGWRRAGGPSNTFPMERGAHGGPGPVETHGFLLMPEDVTFDTGGKDYLRAEDLRQAALIRLGRRKPEDFRPAVRSTPRTLRLMTYNVHSCVGMDGKLAPQRIARVIDHYAPDVVALQELDVGRRRTQSVDQAHLIADYLNMEHHFHPAIHLEEERYGDAILSALPLRLHKAGILPPHRSKPGREPRGALWVEIELEGQTIQIVNTHLGLGRRERVEQIEAILGEDWLGHKRMQGPTIFCGDLNAMPKSKVCRRMRERLYDVQEVLENHRPRKTWFGHYPLARIDHVFISEHFEVISIDVPRTRQTLVASDHLPLIVELRLKD